MDTIEIGGVTFRRATAEEIQKATLTRTGAMNDGLKQIINMERGRIQKMANEVLGLKAAVAAPEATDFEDSHGEALANVMLAYRHLEDARMRLGKVIQALEGGVSVFDKK